MVNKVDDLRARSLPSIGSRGSTSSNARSSRAATRSNSSSWPICAATSRRPRSTSSCVPAPARSSSGPPSSPARSGSTATEPTATSISTPATWRPSSRWRRSPRVWALPHRGLLRRRGQRLARCRWQDRGCDLHVERSADRPAPSVQARATRATRPARRSRWRKPPHWITSPASETLAARRMRLDC